MGTCSYVLTGTEQGMSKTFGSTCHGAVSFVYLCSSCSSSSSSGCFVGVIGVVVVGLMGGVVVVDVM